MNKEECHKHERTMVEERDFSENLLCTRFNFFLIFFSLVVGGAISTSDPLYFKIVLCLGATISFLLALTIARIQKKLDIILEDLFKTEDHVMKIINDRCTGISMRKLIGYWIPTICCSVLILGAILAVTDCLPPPQKGT